MRGWVHRIHDEDKHRERLARERERRVQAYSVRRFAFLYRLLEGPGAAVTGDGPAPTDLLRVGLVDWVRDGKGRIIYGDNRYCLTEAGRALILQWIEQRRDDE